MHLEFTRMPGSPDSGRLGSKHQLTNSYARRFRPLLLYSREVFRAPLPPSVCLYFHTVQVNYLMLNAHSYVKVTSHSSEKAMQFNRSEVSFTAYDTGNLALKEDWGK